MRTAAILTAALACAAVAHAGDIDNEYRLTVFPSTKLSDYLTGFGYLGYVNNPEVEYQTGYLGGGGSYVIRPWLHVWAGLIGMYTDDENKDDTLEIRPFVGPKFFLPNPWKWNIYNFTRYEWRELQNQTTDNWTETQRLRSRFGVEAPLTSIDDAWKPNSWYWLADIEPYYDFDQDTVTLLRYRGGIGRVLSAGNRVELIYHYQFKRGTEDDPLARGDNIIRLNFKIAFGKGAPPVQTSEDAD